MSGMPIIGKVISGGQTGADIAGLRAAAFCGIETGGTAPLGFRTEEGDRPIIGAIYGLRPNSSRSYIPRTAQNIKDSDCTLVIGDIREGGSRLTVTLCYKMKKSVFNVTVGDFGVDQSLKEVADWIAMRRHDRPLIVNIAGNRESKCPGIESKAKFFLIQLFRLVNET